MRKLKAVIPITTTPTTIKTTTVAAATNGTAGVGGNSTDAENSKNSSNSSSSSSSRFIGGISRSLGSGRSLDEMGEFIDWESELGVSNESIDDDIKGTDEVKVFTRLHKTEDEISQLALDEDLDEVKRVLFLLRNGQNVQIPSVLSCLPRLIKERRKDAFALIFPALLESMQIRTRDLQIMAAGILYDLIENSQIPEVIVDETYQCAVKLLNSKDEDVSAVWGDVLIVSIKFMSQKSLHDFILPGCLACSGLSQPVPLRIWSCRMLGAVVSRLKTQE
ncbi:Serine/threonine-protein phosphatase 4 regulatory subunit 4 [Physocladia obscura]|uniref:Serine/threonine-protein phosphatase 4 regulatory subunit 4 n=1 Tax=Physocladia obscura TaxID=109957 RepID=A0AAD5T786_9FUNG|nr:Serine/threonine-protein phosphatase 4 regulatory subunit 4 [Physocladia obscura]